MKKCDTCKYRRTLNNHFICDYASMTREPRGCSVDECDKYIEGKHFIREIRYVIPKEN